MIRMHEGDFAYMIADIATGFVQGGRRTELCDIMLNEESEDDYTSKLAKASAPLGIAGYDREILKLTTVNANNKATASR